MIIFSMFVIGNVSANVEIDVYRFVYSLICCQEQYVFFSMCIVSTGMVAVLSLCVNLNGLYFVSFSATALQEGKVFSDLVVGLFCLVVLLAVSFSLHMGLFYSEKHGMCLDLDCAAI